MSMEAIRRVVIIGGGFGGLLTARALSKSLKEREKVEVVLVDGKDHHTYTPWLYGIATSQLGSLLEDLHDNIEASGALKFRWLIERGGWNLRFRKGMVTRIDTAPKVVHFADGSTITYDKIVLAHGSVVNDFGVPGVMDYARFIQTVPGAFAVRNQISKMLSDQEEEHTIVIVGGGAVGVETAGDLMHFIRKQNHALGTGHSVVMITGSGVLLASDKRYVQERALKRLVGLGVDVRLGARVTKVGRSTVRYIQDGQELTVKASLVIWAGGLKPNKELQTNGLKRLANGQFVVDDALRAMSGVYVLGDMASVKDRRSGLGLPSAAWVALDQSKIVAKNILAELRGKELKRYVPPRYWPSVLLVGGRYGVVTAFGYNVSGILGFWVRRLVDLRYFLHILPWGLAVRHWWKGSHILAKDEA